MSANLVARLRQGGVWRIGRNALSLGALQAGGSLATMALAAMVTRRLGLAGLNRVLLALTVEAIALGVADLGLNTFLTRELARAPDKVEVLLGLALPLKLLASLLAAALVATAVGAAFGPARWGVIALAVMALPCEAFLLTIIAWLKARQEMHTSSAAQLAVRWLFVAGGIACLLAGWDERAVVACWPLATIAGAAWALAWLRREGVRPRWRLERAAGGALLRESLPFAVTGIAAMLYRRVDLLLLSLFRTDAESGAYGAAYRLFEVLALAPAVVLDALFPEMARRSAAEAGRVALLQAYRLGQRLVLMLAALVMLATLALAPLAIRIVYGPDALASDGVALLRLLALALPLSAGYLISGHLLTVLDRQREVTRAMVLVVWANVGLNLLLTPRLGYWGAVATALASELALLVLLRRAAHAALVAETASLEGEVA
jgi:O-antigen/teichoic acid export membrane protein